MLLVLKWNFENFLIIQDCPANQQCRIKVIERYVRYCLSDSRKHEKCVCKPSPGLICWRAETYKVKKCTVRLVYTLTLPRYFWINRDKIQRNCRRHIQGKKTHVRKTLHEKSKRAIMLRSVATVLFKNSIQRLSPRDSIPKLSIIKILLIAREDEQRRCRSLVCPSIFFCFCYIPSFGYPTVVLSSCSLLSLSLSLFLCLAHDEPPQWFDVFLWGLKGVVRDFGHRHHFQVSQCVIYHGRPFATLFIQSF